MAPRGRGRPRKRNTRMDAAVDAMAAMGFEESTVKAAVKELLETYDGEWIFIEEHSYKLLIDTLLEKQEQVEAQQGGKMIEDSSAGPSSPPALPSCSEAVEPAASPMKIDWASSSPPRSAQGGRPNYGWISGNENPDAEPDVIDLPKMTSVPKMSLEQFKMLHCFLNPQPPPPKPSRSRSRWDQGPI